MGNSPPNNHLPGKINVGFATWYPGCKKELCAKNIMQTPLALALIERNQTASAPGECGNRGTISVVSFEKNPEPYLVLVFDSMRRKTCDKDQTVIDLNIKGVLKYWSDFKGIGKTMATSYTIDEAFHDQILRLLNNNPKKLPTFLKSIIEFHKNLANNPTIQNLEYEF